MTRSIFVRLLLLAVAEIVATERANGVPVEYVVFPRMERVRRPPDSRDALLWRGYCSNVAFSTPRHRGNKERQLRNGHG